MRERPETVDVADCPDSLGGPQKGVDRYPLFDYFDSDSLKPDVVDPGTSSRCDQQPIASDFTTVLEYQYVNIAVTARAGCLHAESQLDAVSTQYVTEGFPQLRRFSGEYALGRLNNRHLST
jgi:hypothetical protein